MNMDAADGGGDRPLLHKDGAGAASSPPQDVQDMDPSSPREKTEQNAPGEAPSDAKQPPSIAERRAVLLEKIALYEKRGAILPSDAHTLRFQVHDSTSGQWRAVEERLAQLAFTWNPYQDYSADERREQEQTDSSSSATSPPPKRPGRQPVKKQKKKKDFYELLELSGRDATADEIKKQFRKLALQLHPDKQQQQQAASAASSTATASDEQLSTDLSDSTEFARLRVAYETLSDPDQRAAYDAKLVEMESGVSAADAFVEGIHVKDQVTLEASTDFASLEWMARVKHKMDVMDRIAEWATLLHIRATELRFETGEPCVGKGCGKIVSMDRDLECYGSPRRRVYVCLLHKYIHACDESCTSHYGDPELDRKVCAMRAYWLVQNWIFDTLQQQQISAAHRTTLKADEETKDDSAQQPQVSCDQLVASEIHLGDAHTTFSCANARECCSRTCATRFQFLEDGIFVCRRHGTAHVCTFHQCGQRELKRGRYVCWVSGKVYGYSQEEIGTGTRTRRIMYTDEHGESASIDIEVPVTLPLGMMTSFLLEGGPKAAVDRSSSLSPPPPAQKTWGYGEEDDEEIGSPSRMARPRRATTLESYKRAREEETSPVRARIRRRLDEKVDQSDPSFYVYMHVPPAVANLPKVALELQEQMPVSRVVRVNGSPEEQDEAPAPNVLPIRVRPRNTLNYIKHWMEELADQLISIWDQQILWGDTLIGDEGRVMTLHEHGIHDGVHLELRLQEDCPLLVGNWAGKQTLAGEYNTVQISKEAEEDLDDQQEEQEDVIEAEEEAFQRDWLNRKREKMEQVGAINHVEVIEYHGDQPKLLGVIPERRQSVKHLTASSSEAAKPINVKHLEIKRSLEKDAIAMKRIASTAESVRKKSSDDNQSASARSNTQLS